MRPYAEQEVFSTREVELFRQATALVALLPDLEELRCHELARFIGERLGLEVQDGYFGFVEHSWCWTTPRADDSEYLWRLPNILDVYVPGELPQVQLIHTTTALPMPYRFGASRRDIRSDLLAKLATCLGVKA